MGQRFITLELRRPRDSKNILKLYIAVLLFYTIPVTSARVERFFCKLKLIKSYRKTSTIKDHPKYFSLVATENNAASKFHINEMIDQLSIIKNTIHVKFNLIHINDKSNN